MYFFPPALRVPFLRQGSLITSLRGLGQHLLRLVLNTCGPLAYHFSPERKSLKQCIHFNVNTFFSQNISYFLLQNEPWWPNLCLLLCKALLVCHLVNNVPNVSSVMVAESRVEVGFFFRGFLCFYAISPNRLLNSFFQFFYYHSSRLSLV